MKSFLKSLAARLVAPASPAEVAPARWVWLASLAIALFYGLQCAGAGLASPDIIQDDARQHLFWMARFVNPDRFPNDFIADYFQSVAPPGYRGLYWALAQLGLPPLVAGKLLPAAIGLTATVFCLRASLRLVPVPAVAFASALLLNQALWMEDGVASATPRAFVYPLFLGFLDGWLRRDRLAVWLALALQGSFYPQILLVSVGVLTVRLWQPLPPGLGFPLQLPGRRSPGGSRGEAPAGGSPDRRIDLPGRTLLESLRRRWGWRPGGGRAAPTARVRWEWQLWAGGMAIAAATAIALSGSLADSPYGPTLTAAEARQLTEFAMTGEEYGRSFYFHPNPLIFWLFAPRSGFLFLGAANPLMLAGLGLPWLLRQRSRARPTVAEPSRMASEGASAGKIEIASGGKPGGAMAPVPALAARISPEIAVLGAIVLASLGWFLVAHAVAFRLHLPARYSYYSLRVVLALAAGPVLAALGAASLRRAIAAWEAGRRWRVRLGLGFGGLVLAIAVLLPFTPGWSLAGQLHLRGKMPEVYAFLRSQPNDTLVASLAKGTDFIPALAERSVYAGREFLVPYHRGYAAVLRDRVGELLRAQYGDSTALQTFIRDRGIDYWLIEPWSLTADHLEDSNWLLPFQPARDEVLASLRAGNVPAIAGQMERCRVLESDDRWLLDARCLLAAPPPGSP